MFLHKNTTESRPGFEPKPLPARDQRAKNRTTAALELDVKVAADPKWPLRVETWNKNPNKLSESLINEDYHTVFVESKKINALKI